MKPPLYYLLTEPCAQCAQFYRDAFLSIAVFDLNPQQEAMLILFGALPPAVLNFIFAERYNQEPAKVASIVIIGNALTIISIPLTLAYVLSRYPLT